MWSHLSLNTLWSWFVLVSDITVLRGFQKPGPGVPSFLLHTLIQIQPRRCVYYIHMYIYAAMYIISATAGFLPAVGIMPYWSYYYTIIAVLILHQNDTF